MNTYSRFNVCLTKGQGAKFYDPEGKEYIDFSSGIGVNSLGTGDPDWVKAVCDQANALAHTSNLFYTQPAAQLAQKLCKLSGMDKAFFANSGAEANEGAIKLARKYSRDKYGEDRNKIITLINSFHGRTVTTLAATGQDVFHQHFFPFTPGFDHAPANDIGALKAALDDTCCAVMLELIQGEGGVMPLDGEYLTQVKTLCEENDLLIIADEVQTGIGRTGAVFAYQNSSITPDIVTSAKGLGGGLPIGAVLANKKCAQVLTPATHATTFGANPVCCAGAVAVLDKMTPEFLAEVAKKGEYIKQKLPKSPHIESVRGAGLMIGIKLTGLVNKELCAKLIDAGLLCITAGDNVLRFLPPLTITYEEIDAGLKILEGVL